MLTMMMIATAMAATSTAAPRLKPAISAASQSLVERVAAARLVSGIGGTDTTATSAEVARDSRTETVAGDDTLSSETVGRTGVGSNVPSMSVTAVVANVIVAVDAARGVTGTEITLLRVAGFGTGVVVMRPTHGS